MICRKEKQIDLSEGFLTIGVFGVRSETVYLVKRAWKKDMHFLLFKSIFFVIFYIAVVPFEKYSKLRNRSIWETEGRAAAP